MLDAQCELFRRLLRGAVIARRFSVFAAVAASGLLIQLILLGLFFQGLQWSYTFSLTASVVLAMTFNYVVHNALTFSDRNLSGATYFKGWFLFCMGCAIGGFLNTSTAWICFYIGWHWVVAGTLGAVIGGVVNFLLASKLIWKIR